MDLRTLITACGIATGMMMFVLVVMIFQTVSSLAAAQTAECHPDCAVGPYHPAMEMEQ